MDDNSDDQNKEITPLEKFYYENFADLPKPKKFKKESKQNLKILTYNVHGWQNLHKDVNFSANYQLIFKMISKYDFDIIVFQEVGTYHGLANKNIKLDFKEIGYKHMYHVPNGGDRNSKHNDSFIMVLSKDKIKNPKSLDLSNYTYKRNCIYFEVEKLKVVAIHLEIGERFHHLPEDDPKREKIIFNNILRRKWQLQRILNTFEEIDVIVGDFNFAEGSPEYEFITKKGFISEGLKENTTPYNKVDFMFINEKSKFKFVDKASKIIKCNYSDHLPLSCELTPI